MRKKFLLILFLSLVSVLFVGCNTLKTYDLENIKFEDKTVYYDGEVHSLKITGELPEGVSVSYENNDHAQIGEYEVIANFIGDVVSVQKTHPYDIQLDYVFYDKSGKITDDEKEIRT